MQPNNSKKRFLTTKEVPSECRPNCGGCPFAIEGKPPHRPVLGEVPSQAGGVLIGEGPGRDEVQQGQPFVGRTGEQLDLELAEAGIKRSSLAIINATACMPPPGATDGMKQKARVACKPLTDWQLAQVGGRLPTLAMGKLAAQAVLGRDAPSIENGRGFVRDGWLIITYHPTYAFFYVPWKWGDFSVDVRRFKRLMDGTLEASPDIAVPPTEAAFRKLQQIAHQEGAVAVDIETGGVHGKDPTRAELKIVGFGTRNFATAFHWNDAPWARQEARRILADPTLPKIFHNGWTFDQPVLRRYKISIRGAVFDTRDMRRATSATSALSLRYLGSIMTDVRPWKELSESEGSVGDDDHK